MDVEFPFKIETLMEQCGGSKPVAEAILDEFLIQVPDDTKEMEECLAKGNLTQVGKAAHRLKGTAGVLGAMELHPLCFDLEQAGKEGDAEKAAKVYPNLKAEADRCIAAVPEARTKL